ncbi:class I SAM-dependent rRNA methyltransferase [bacterium]|jgi:23S rRNA (cytosine1962-C5)-methyltransferase|nr:class I SAM-dependent rRNA methyltransferase [bacterium]
MKESKFRRYQVRKKTLIQMNREHPWVFHGSISTAAKIFQDGDWLRLVDGTNETIGFGIYSEDEPIAIRIFHFGDSLRNRFLLKKMREIWKKKKDLLTETDALRLIHGESDLIPGVTVDLYSHVAIVQYYSASTYTLARLISFLLPHVVSEPFAKSIQVRAGTRMGLSSAKTRPPRWTRGSEVTNVTIREGQFHYAVDFAHGQKGGFYLDLRGVRRYLGDCDLEGMEVLNIFAYTGPFSVIALKKGAKRVVSVDQSRHAQDQHLKNLELNGLNSDRDELVRADAFQFLADLDTSQKFDLIIIDPPSLAAKQNQVPLALKKFEQLHRLALRHLKPRSHWFSICCTARMTRDQVVQTVGKVSKDLVGKGETQIVAELPSEIDHTLSKKFPEGNYLTQLVFSNFKEAQES